MVHVEGATRKGAPRDATKTPVVSKPNVPTGAGANPAKPTKGGSNPAREETKLMWRHADAVCFDVDSTVCPTEAIDELATFCGKKEQVQRVTIEAMGGKMEFRDALKLRLDIIRPSREAVARFVKDRPHSLTPGIRELVSKLHKRGVQVYLVSGGFQSLIAPVAQELDVPMENVFANRLKFYFDGTYAGFDEEQPTSASGGKGLVVGRLKEKYNYSCLVMIGDGATDMEACPPADAFIGFGGCVVREQVKAGSKWFVYGFQELIEALN
ncbi:unnamed protein product [Darwinula stevensoni]|uniref:Phosphoserine phosphatase n=1 Tax=Darwinula stevensoni TaxID=69355 RepID=A0A7R9A5H9_9CRUS|nr:unnamed protein product [Darwinula stevensoni]CAG0895632.1 unnamed protein product [Darwinula stevensoni]